MRFVFVQPPFKNWAVINPPLGLAYLSAVLRQKMASVEVFVIDANAERITPQEATKKILELKPDVLGVTITTPQVDVALDIIKKVKSSLDIPVIVGGPHPTVMPQELLACEEVDIVARSEAEETIVELGQYFCGLRQLSSIKGVSFKENGRMQHNPDRPLINELDCLPFPAWDTFPLHRYSSIGGKKGFCLPVMSSRGCPFGCVFCYKGVFGRTWRARSPENVIAELLYLRDKFKIEEFVFLDDNFALDEERALRICDGIIQGKLNLPWRLSSGIAVKSSSSRIFLKLKEAGCYQVAIAVESGNRAVLDYINKGITLEQIENTFRLAREAGLETVAFFMIGNLTENEKTMDDTIRFAIKLSPDLAAFTVATPYPGTRMYEIIEKEGRMVFGKWEDLASYAGRAVFQHKELTPELIQKKYQDAYRRFYLRPKYILKWFTTVSSWRELSNMFKGAGLLLRMIGLKK